MLTALLGWKAGLLAWWAAGKAKVIIWALAGVLLLAAFGFVFYFGWSIARDRCNTAGLRARIATLEKDLDNVKNAAFDDRIKSEEDREMAENHRKTIDALERKLKELPQNSACLVAPSDVAPRGVRR